jgi:hypothetical protein
VEMVNRPTLFAGAGVVAAEAFTEDGEGEETAEIAMGSGCTVRTAKRELLVEGAAGLAKLPCCAGCAWLMANRTYKEGEWIWRRSRAQPRADVKPRKVGARKKKTEEEEKRKKTKTKQQRRLRCGHRSRADKEMILPKSTGIGWVGICVCGFNRGTHARSQQTRWVEQTRKKTQPAAKMADTQRLRTKDLPLFCFSVLHSHLHGLPPTPSHHIPVENLWVDAGRSERDVLWSVCFCLFVCCCLA